MVELNNIIINPVDPTTFEYQEYSEKDNNLISSSRLDTAFTMSTDYIEYYIYDDSKNLVFPLDTSSKIYDQRNYSVIDGDTILRPSENLKDIGYDNGTYYSTYNFYRKQLSSDQFNNYYISEISGDRTEVRLKSTTIPSDLIISSSNSFIQYREDADYFVDFLLNFGGDQQVIANNLRLDTSTEIDPSLLIKLYEPLPSNFNVKDTLWVVEEISTPQAYIVEFPEITFIPDDFQFIKGPNYSIKLTQQVGESTQEYNYNTLLGTNITSSSDQLKNILNRKEIDINVDYKDYKNFVHFSSANTRLENFYYKVSLIQSNQNEISNLPLDASSYSSSKAEISTRTTKIIEAFDGYDYFLYYNSGSSKSYPKSTTTPPYILMSTGSNEVKTWLGSADPDNPYYGGQALSASNYDENNQDYLYNAIPEYLKSDPNNEKYELFVDMVAQQYDNTWLYTKNITTRFDADNRLDYGISKDLVADAIRDFGVKLYSNNFNANDLYTAFLGITPSGSSFPFPNMTDQLAAPSGFQYVDTQISASNDIVPLDDVNKSLYKRIYHNMPLLLKKKGTIAGLRALITAYGIPSTILRINEFGGKDRNDFQDWDYSEDVFNYAFHSDSVSASITSSFQLNSGFTPIASETRPKTLQFRFKTPGIPETATPIHQNLWVGDQTTSFITLEYTGSGMTSQSYSGSSPSESNAYGTLTFYPDGNNGITKTASIDLPFFDGGWWSVMATVDYTSQTIPAYLYSANRIGDKIGHSASDSVIHNWQYFDLINKSSFPYTGSMTVDGDVVTPFSGAYQEIRYWDVPLSESLFYDYVVNPYSTQGNTINSTPQDLAFRADLGTQLITASRESIHPKITGSWDITQSFSSNDSSFYVKGDFIQNTESIFLNQVPGGIKNRISDQVKIVQEILPSGSTLSPYRSIQQSPFPSGSNPSINYLEVAFSPTDQVNDDIIAQIGAFNLGDYIGDPRQISESGYSYPQLDALRDAYFTKYISSYDVNDFIRLISFFDNSLFKMIEDFTPARTSLTSGIVVKQNLLERNRQAPPAMSFTTPVYSGSVKSFPRDYQVPNSSSSFPAYGNISGSAIYKFGGGTGGVFEPFNNNFAAPVSQSGAKTCLEGYFYTSSNTLIEVNDTLGESIFSTTNIDNNPTTMSINLRGQSGINNFDFLQLLSTSSLTQDNFLLYGPLSSGGTMRYKINKIAFGGGYGGFESNYGVALYGVNYSSSVFFELAVVSSSGFVPTEEEEVDICFEISGEPYSGLSNTDVSASEFYAQYPGFTQQWSESIVPSLGIPFPYDQGQSESNGIPPVNYNRVDQREFYNGEFGNAIQVGTNEICKTFFGQEYNIDYFFRIQWFNQSTITETDFLSEDYLPQLGETWFWADTVNQLGILTPDGINGVFISQQPIATSLATSTVSVDDVTFSTDGTGAGATFTVSVIQNKRYKVFVDDLGAGYNVGDKITFTAATLQAAGFPNITQDLIVNLQTRDVAYNVTNKVKYIKMNNEDNNSEPIQPFITDSNYVIFNLTGASDYLNALISGFNTFFIANTSLQTGNNTNPDDDSTLLIINQEPSSDAVTSYDTNFYNLTFSASGVFSYYATQSGDDPNVVPSTGITESISQGYFPPVPTYPTESFFRGWASASYFQTDDNGDVFKVGTSPGFNTDTFGNFNTGSTEFDGDTQNLPSTVPWFMNAKAETYQALSASSLVTGGPPSITKLALYTGDITASSVPIGPAYEIYTPQALTDANVVITTISTPPTNVLTINCPGLSSLPTSLSVRSIPIEFSQGGMTWYYEFRDPSNFDNYFPGENGGCPWINVSFPNGMAPLETRAGTFPDPGICTISILPSQNLNPPYINDSTRSAKLFIINAQNPSNSYYCNITQIEYVDENGGGGGYDPGGEQQQ